MGARQWGAGGAARCERQGRPCRPPWSPIRQHVRNPNPQPSHAWPGPGCEALRTLWEIAGS
eukprot:4767810-Prymnesium_polylepis.1